MKSNEKVVRIVVAAVTCVALAIIVIFLVRWIASKFALVINENAENAIETTQPTEDVWNPEIDLNAAWEDDTGEVSTYKPSVQENVDFTEGVDAESVPVDASSDALAKTTPSPGDEDLFDTDVAP